MEFHSSAIVATSEGRNQGSTFTIELMPATKNCRPAVKVNVEPPIEKLKAAGARILLVEDHEPTRSALAVLLLRRNFKVLTASTLHEARAVVNQEEVDLVISDIGLPDGSGNDLMIELANHYGLKGIALTGYGMEQDIERSLAAGFIAHLTKPVDIKSLENVLAVTTPMARA